MKTITRLIPMFWLALPVFIANATDLPTDDAPDAADFPGIKRYEGALILRQDKEAYGQTQFQIAPHYGNAEPEIIKTLEGEVHRTLYIVPPSQERPRTALEVFRNYERALADQGFEVVWKAEDRRDFGSSIFRNRAMNVDFYLALLHLESRHTLYLHAEKPGISLGLHVAQASRDIGTNFLGLDLHGGRPTIPTGAIGIHLEIVSTQPMDERMVFVEAEQMKTTISGEGFIDIYGIQFGFDSAEIEEESAPTLLEIVTLLTDNPDLKLMIVGHTDNVGAYDYNQRLSEQRAQAVVRYLTGNHGIAADRLSAHGVGYAAPVASNQTDEGRAKNRRVVLVEQ